MTTLYLTTEGSILKLKDNQLIISKSDDILKKISIEKVNNIILVGQTHLSTPLTVELLKREISVTWLSKTGKFYGRLESTQSINIERQREQFRRSDDNNFSLAISKTFITGKIKNSQVILRRYNRNFNFQEVDEIIGELKRYTLKAESSQKIEELLGYEGNASKIYFKGLSMLVKAPFKFTGRSKQPPRDKFNSLLSFGYTLLMYEIYTAIQNRKNCIIKFYNNKRVKA